MNDPSDTQQELRKEIAVLGQKIRALEDPEAQRKRVEAALRTGEEKFRQLFDNSPTGLYQIDFRTGKFLKANRAICDFFGVREEDLASVYLYDFLTDGGRQLLAKRLQKMALGEKVPANPEFEIIDKKGAHRWVQLYATNICDAEGSVIGADVVAHEITDRKRVEEALRDSERKYRLLTDKMVDIVWMVDMELRTLYVTPSVETVLGFSQEERMRQTVAEQLTPGSLSAGLEAMARELALDKEGRGDPDRIVPLVLEYYHKDGSTRWMETIISGIRDDRGALIGLHGVSRDITARRQAEEERDRLQAQLSQAQRLESIGTLAGGIAHDFNNLLMGIQGYVSLTMLDLDPSHPHYENLKRIETHVQSGAALTRQLLGFARGGLYEIKSADMNEILKKTSALFGRTKKEIAIHHRYGKDLWPVEVDQGQMEQVFLNLYVNAGHAMPGGGTILLETENVLLGEQEALPHAITPGNYVKITVGDTGTGMDEKTKARIFDPFFTTKGMGRGTGLGLATVYGIITGHKGMIHVDSEPGRGTTFTIFLPASEKKALKDIKEPERLVRGTETILLVDDEALVLDVSRRLLEYLGYRVHAAANGQEAISLFREKGSGIDLVILDMIMPGLSGSEVFNQLRQVDAGIKVLLSSGYSIDGQAQQILERGCNGFLQKPFHLEQLAGKVREILG